MNTDSGELVPRDGETQGEIVLRGNAVMKGYYKDPDATGQRFMMAGSSLVMPLSGMIMAISRSRTG